MPRRIPVKAQADLLLASSKAAYHALAGLHNCAMVLADMHKINREEFMGGMLMSLRNDAKRLEDMIVALDGGWSPGDPISK